MGKQVQHFYDIKIFLKTVPNSSVAPLDETEGRGGLSSKLPTIVLNNLNKIINSD